jgi:hypothetical protein
MKYDILTITGGAIPLTRRRPHLSTPRHAPAGACVITAQWEDGSQLAGAERVYVYDPDGRIRMSMPLAHLRPAGWYVGGAYVRKQSGRKTS